MQWDKVQRLKKEIKINADGFRIHERSQPRGEVENVNSSALVSERETKVE